MSWLTSWRLAFRLARRDLLKHKARAIIALVMVTLPVFGVVAADILSETTSVSTVEGIDRQLGSVATASLRLGGDHQVVQSIDPSSGWGTGKRLDRSATQADIEKVIGRRTMQPLNLAVQVLAETSHGRELARADQIDPSTPLASGLYRLVSGRWPSGPGQVVVNQALRDRGIGETLTVVSRDSSERKVQVVGTIEDASTRTFPVVVGLPGWLPAGPSEADMGGGPTGVTPGPGWLIDGAWITPAQLHALNDLGVVVADRYMITHADEFHDELGSDGGYSDDETAQVIALIVVMALIEVVLLAGPAFAVGARKQQRSLALVVASGGTPTQARRVIVAGGWLLGLSAAVGGVVLGIGAAWALQPVAQRFSDTWLGPFQIPWSHLAAVALFGLVSALVACVVPAWIASRQNVVAVLAGRRGDAKPVRAFPWIGLALFGIGVVVAVMGARPSGGQLTIAWAAVICVLGMVLLVPVVVSWMARIAGRFPLPVRFAARDAVRHRTRTTPAVAAVAATVAGVVALGISTASDEKENRETYTPSLVMGDAAVSAQPYDDFGDPTGKATDWKAVEAAVRAQVPNARITRVSGLQDEYSPKTWTAVDFEDPTAAKNAYATIGPGPWANVFGTDVIVSDGTDLPRLITQLAPDAAEALRAGKAVVFTADPSTTRLDSVVINVERHTPGKRGHDRSRVTVPAEVVEPKTGMTPPHALLPPKVAAEAGVPVTTTGLDVTQPGLSKSQQKDLNATLLALPTPASITVERGYEPSSDIAIIQALLLALAAVLMLGGTLTAMFLALSDARPDLATLAAVGAEARVRRKVAASYTFVVAFVGAVLGMVVGFVPGIAVTRPLTVTDYYGQGSSGPFLDIPWLLIVLVVVGLPVLSSLLVGACVRSRLPMMKRLS